MKRFFVAHTLPATEGDIQWLGGGGGDIWYGSRRRWSWAELATSSLEGGSTTSMCISQNRFVDLVRIYMNKNEHRCDKTCLQGF